MSRHTPGPWMWDESWGAIMANHSGGSRLVCPMWTGSDRRGLGRQVEDEDMANARLIEAAPELLAACKMVVEYYEKMSGNPNAPIPDKYWIRGALLARAAIAKAEGGKP